MKDQFSASSLAIMTNKEVVMGGLVLAVPSNDSHSSQCNVFFLKAVEVFDGLLCFNKLIRRTFIKSCCCSSLI